MPPAAAEPREIATPLAIGVAASLVSPLAAASPFLTAASLTFLAASTLSKCAPDVAGETPVSLVEELFPALDNDPAEELETDALQDDISADDLANMGKNGKGKKKNGITKSITKVMDGVGTALSVNPRLDAANRRGQAARLREELAQLESLDQSSANVPPPAP
ncbi:MAG: hypothetical protein WA172_19320 [Terriglobales bacterium]